MLSFKVPQMYAAIMLPESGRAVMNLDILPHLKIMSHLIRPDFYVLVSLFMVTFTFKA